MTHIQLLTLAPNAVQFCWPAMSKASLCIQGAVAVEGEGHLWRPSRRASTTAAQDAPASASVQPAQTTQSATITESPAGSQDSRAAGVSLLQLCGTLCSYCVVIFTNCSCCVYFQAHAKQ